MADAGRARPQACPQWQGDLAAWVTAQGDPAGEAAFVAHLEGCAACRVEADALLAVAAVALVADVDRAAPTRPAPAPSGSADDRDLEPPPDLGDRVAARVRAERRRQAGRRLVLVAVAAAAAAAMVVGAVLLVGGDDGPGPLRGDEFAFTVGRGGAVVAPDGAASTVQLTASGLDPGVVYALWLSVPGGGRDERVPAGTFRPDADGTVDVRLPCALPAEQVGRVWATTPDGALALDTE